MSEKGFGEQETEKTVPACPICDRPIADGSHSGCHVKEFKLLSRAKENFEKITPEDRELLSEIGYHELEIEKNEFKAMRAFNANQDFEGLRQTADKLLRDKSNSFDLLNVLILLEDHEGLRRFLNSRYRKIEIYDPSFRELRKPLYDYVRKFLEDNQTPVATGIINEGPDLVAIRNLSQQYDMAVPIARGGLNQGAIAGLWGMPTRIVDIAAHNRKVPKGKWVNPVTPEDFTGKRVLLFDKDAVSGASIRKAVKMLAPFKPSGIGVYFAHNAVPAGSTGMGTRLEGLPTGIKIFYPDNAPFEHAGDAYLEAHERLGTLYGRRRLIEHSYTEQLIPDLEKQYPAVASAMRAFLSRHLRVFDSLNPFLAGVVEARELILVRLKKINEECVQNLKNGLFEFFGTENFGRILDHTQPSSFNLESIFITARYQKQAEDMAKKRGIENHHHSSRPLESFYAASMAVKKGFDAALIVGPEGFAYEPYFRDLGMSIVAVNIPESLEGEPRTIKLFNDLSKLRGKKVLVVEDDVRTGATLQKVLETFGSDRPAHIGLYLGLPTERQRVSKIPSEFEDVFIAGAGATEAEMIEAFHKHLESKGLKIFKSTKKSDK